MKKQFVSMLCGAAAVAMTVPAFAATELTGIFRVQGVDQSAVLAKDAPDCRFIAQRLRAKVTNTVNDYLAVIWFGEIDTDWGVKSAKDQAGDGDLGNGGAQGADGINVETKNVYATLKVPGSMDVKLAVGIQGIADNMQNVYINDDAAALVARAMFGTVGVDVGYSKLQENALDMGDDVDLYFVRANVTPAENMKFGAELYWYHDGAGTNEFQDDIYTIAVNGAAKVAVVNIDGFIGYQTGTLNQDGGDGVESDVAALAASVAAGMKINDNVGANLRVIYYGNDDDDEKTMSWQGDKGALAYMNSNMPIMLRNSYKTGQNAGTFTDGLALTAVGFGYGLLGIVANADATFDPYFVKGGIGYFMTLDDKANGEKEKSIEGTNIGTEICVQAGMKVAEKATLSVRGSYAMLGDAFDGAAVNDEGEDPDNMYSVALIMDVPF